MSRVKSPWVLPDRAEDRAAKANAEIRIVEFVLFAVIPLRSVAISWLPANELAALAIVLLAAMRRPTGHRGRHGLVMWLGAAIVGLLLFSGIANDLDWTRRVGHVTIWCGLVWACATGRVSLRSAALGLAAGLIAVIGLFQIGVGGDTYDGRLTGFLADPNAAAFFIVSLGALAVGFADERGRVRLLIAAPLIAGLLLTYSRTGLLALAFALVWWLVGRRLGSLGGAAIVGGLVWVVDNIPDELVNFGPFSNRSGSDALRNRIIEREHELLAQSPWFGTGPGTAKVNLAGDEFFFHNSYLAVRQEGGWPLLVLILALVAIAFIALSRRSRARDLRAVAAQAALISTLTMAVTLGEVLLELCTAIAIGFALGHAASRTPDGTRVTPVTDSTLPKSRKHRGTTLRAVGWDPQPTRIGPRTTTTSNRSREQR